jgi:surface polysaccharide O-acyltransferase-like enzyme
MTQRNTNIDILKVVLAFMVIAGHLFPTNEIISKTGTFYYYINGFIRITIPVFLMISGYYLRNHIKNREYLKKYGIRILKLFLVWQIIYLPIIFSLYLKKQVDLERVIYDIIYGTGHLWYLIAMAQAVFLIYLTRKLSVNNKMILAFSILFIGYFFQFILATEIVKNETIVYTNYIIGTTRNFLFFAFPFMLLGTIYDSWKAYVYKFRLIFIPLTILFFLEIAYYYSIKILPLNIFVMTIPLSMIVVCYAFESKKSLDIKVNSSLSLGIYLCHFYPVYFTIIKVQEVSLGFMMYKYAIVCIFTLIIWFILDRINKKIAIFF